ERLLRNINPSKRKPATYAHTNTLSSRSLRSGRQLTESTAFTLALRSTAEAGTAVPLTDAEKEMLQKSFPFEQSFRVTLDTAAKMDFFRERYGFAEDAQAASVAIQTEPEANEPLELEPGPSWRRINDDWLQAGHAMAKSTPKRKKGPKRTA